MNEINSFSFETMLRHPAFYYRKIVKGEIIHNAQIQTLLILALVYKIALAKNTFLIFSFVLPFITFAAFKFPCRILVYCIPRISVLVIFTLEIKFKTLQASSIKIYFFSFQHSFFLNSSLPISIL